MLVTKKPDVIFVKTFKTGGTTTEAVLESAFWGGEPRHESDLRLERNGLCTPREGGAKAGPHEMAALRALGFHVPFFRPISRIARLKNHSSPASIVQALGPRRWERSLKIANVRNPFDLVVSQYFFAQKKNPLLPSFSEWVGTATRPKVNDELVGFSRDSASWRFIRFETLEDDLRSVLAHLGLSEPTTLPQFKGDIRPATTRDFRTMYDEKSRHTVTALYSDWIEQFGYHWA